MRISTLLAAVAALSIATTAIAQSTTAQPDMQQQLQKILGKKGNQQALGQAMATGVLLGCVNKKVGKDATQAYYQEVQTVGKTVEGYCKQGNATEARSLVLATLDAKRSDPVTEAAIGCYDSQQSSIAGMAGQKTADEVAKYARWAHDPALAHSEMQTTDICR